MNIRYMLLPLLLIIYCHAHAQTRYANIHFHLLQSGKTVTVSVQEGSSLADAVSLLQKRENLEDIGRLSGKGYRVPHENWHKIIISSKEYYPGKASTKPVVVETTADLRNKGTISP